MITAKDLRAILIEKNRDIKLDELPEVLEYLKVCHEFFEILKEDEFRRTKLKEIYGDRLYKLLCVVNGLEVKGGER